MSVKQATKDVEDKDSKLKLDGSVIGEFINHRLNQNRDAKITITAKNSGTGLGKSTLALLMARWVDDDFSAEENVFINVKDYIKAYKEASPGTALILDEIEAGADSRRAMSHDNVELSKVWATMRYKNVITFTTLPTTTMLDKRLKGLSDVWINVLQKGVAQAYFIWINDFNHQLKTVATKHPLTGETEVLLWNAVDDEDFRYMQSLKERDLFGKDQKRYEYSEVKDKMDKARKEKRNEAIRELYEKTNLSQKQISNFDFVDISQQSVSHAINSQKGK